jgi:hypothetical protein
MCVTDPAPARRAAAGVTPAQRCNRTYAHLTHLAGRLVGFNMLCWAAIPLIIRGGVAFMERRDRRCQTAGVH